MLRYAAAQQNWAAVPCYQPRASYEAINRMFVDSLHNEIILNSVYGYSTCNITYKGVFAFDGNNFRDLDFGIDKHNANPFTAGNYMMACIPYNGKTLFGGGFYSVGSNTLYAKSIALWDGAVWDTFPKFVFPNDLSERGGGISGFLKHNGKLWIYGGFDTIGGIVSKNVCGFDGNNFISVPALPDFGNDYIIGKMIVYKNKLIATGDFYDQSSWSARVAMYDGSSWSSVGNGVKGDISFVIDMAIYRDTLYIAGSWPAVGGNISNHIMKWDGTQLYDAGFGNYYGTDAISNLVVYKDRLFAFGNFGHAANQKAFGIAYYKDGTWTVPKDSIANHGVRYGVVHNDALYIAGGFKNINNDTTIKNFARLVCPDFDAVSGCISGLKESSLNRLNLKVFPNPANDELFVETDYNVKIERLSITNTLGEEIFKALNPELRDRLDISFLPKGIYFLSAENKQGRSVFKVVKE
jgi:hypothetical protein